MLLFLNLFSPRRVRNFVDAASTDVRKRAKGVTGTVSARDAGERAHRLFGGFPLVLQLSRCAHKRIFNASQMSSKRVKQRVGGFYDLLPLWRRVVAGDAQTFLVQNDGDDIQRHSLNLPEMGCKDMPQKMSFKRDRFPFCIGEDHPVAEKA